MIRYVQSKTPMGAIIIQRFEGQSVVQFTPDHPCSEAQEYRDWVAAGNTPEIKPDPEPPGEPGPTLEDRVKAAEMLINLILDEEGV